MSEKLNAETVRNLIIDCLYSEEEINTEDLSKSKKVESILATFSFNPKKLVKNEEAIVELLSELPLEFRKSVGGGWSFLNACDDRHGDQWTGFHSAMDELFVLGMAIDKVSCLIPRELWKSLPGGMPYYIIEM